MKKNLLSLIAALIMFSTQAQNAAEQNTTPQVNVPKDAKVDGTIIDMKNKHPLNNELIVFRSQKNTNEYQAISNESGVFSTRLPIGDKYDIFVMGFKDSSSYNILDIPALKANAFYKDPFTVNLEFEPAKTFVLDNVEFDFGKATLRPEAYAALDDLVEYLNRKSTDRIEIGGHTDNVGSDEKNLLLSMERAKSIVAYLVAKGIENERLVAKGYGAEEPIEENTTETGRQKNRRTEVKILE